jgi:myeloid leukemia factor 1
MQSNPAGFSYSSSRVMSYSNDGRNPPQYFEASSSTKQAPGGVKETQKTVRDSESGLHKMAVGHHIG